jgi:hypothetical protein
MNTKVLHPHGFILPGILALLTFLVLPHSTAFAQGTAFTYQGRLNDGGTPANGSYDVTFALYSVSSGDSAIAGPITNSAVAVLNGLFTATLDFGANFPGADRWLEIAVRPENTGDFITLSPRQQLTATPYAIMAGDVTGGNVARLNVPNTAEQATGHPIVTGGLITSAVVDNGGSGYAAAPTVTVNANGPGTGAKITTTVSGSSVVALNVIGAGSGYTTSATVTIGLPPPNNYQVFVTSNSFPNVNVFSNPSNIFAGTFTGSGAGLTNLNAWQLNGNAGTSPGAPFLGTTDNQPLEFKVNNQRALRVEPNTKGAPNLIGGSLINFVGPTTVGAVIAGGGATNYDFASHTNSVAADFGTIGGGLGNIIEADAVYSTISGGDDNTIRAGALESSIGGGGGNYIEAGAFNSSIGGGVANQIWADAIDSRIGGGVYNWIQDGARDSSIGGGFNNMVQIGAYGAAIGGGTNNTVQNGAYIATIGGGINNTIQTNAYGATIGGGFFNTVSGTRAAIPGGDNNFAGAYCFAAGHYAQALHDGCFVWSDCVSTNVKSTATNQFVVGASGGVWLQGTNTSLKVDGSSTFGGYSVFNAGLTASNGVTINGYSYINNGVQISGSASINGYSYLNNGATIYNGATINGTAYLNNGATINGFSYINNGVAVYGNADFYGYPYMYNGLWLSGYNYYGWELQLQNDSAVKPNGGSWANYSDARLKKNIQPLTGALAKLVQLRGVTFEWINPAEHANQTNVQSGFIAQEVERVFPEWITQVGAAGHDKALTADGKVRSLSLPFGYDALVVEALKELRAEKDASIAELKEKNCALEKQLAAQAAASARAEARLADLEKAVAGMTKQYATFLAANSIHVEAK